MSLEISRKVLSGNWQKWRNLRSLSTPLLFCPVNFLHSSDFLGLGEIILGKEILGETGLKAVWSFSTNSRASKILSQGTRL